MNIKSKTSWLVGKISLPVILFSVSVVFLFSISVGQMYAKAVTNNKTHQAQSGTVVTASIKQSGVTEKQVTAPKVQAHDEAVTGNYVYQASTDSTVTVPTYLSNGTERDITIPNQNPPSILQKINFPATPAALNESEDCLDLQCYFSDDDVLMNFVLADGSTLPYDGYPMTADDEWGDIISADNQTSWNDGDLWVQLSSMTYFGLSDISTTSDEDAVINSIAQTGKFTIQSGIGSPLTTDTFPQNASVPATNCVQLDGTGPIKIAFVRGDTWNSSVGDFLSVANDIENQIKSIDPFKTYQGKLSFEADLKKMSHTALEKAGSMGETTINSPDTSFDAYEYSFAAGTYVRANSSCSATVYISIDNSPAMYPAYSISSKGVVFLNISDPLGISGFSNPFGNRSLDVTAVHELGHALALLNDEYVIPKNPVGNAGIVDEFGNTYPIENCSVDPWSTYSYNGQMYGSVNDTGCNYSFNPSAQYIYYRPSNDSIMDHGTQSDDLSNAQFNIISCGYIIAALDGEPTDYNHASPNWPECKTMAQATPSTIIGLSELPTVGPAPVVITAGGFFTDENSALFTWLDKVLPSSVQQVAISSKTFSMADIQNKLRSAINNALAGHHPVVVIGHSSGAFNAYAVSSEYIGEDVQFIYLDPPYGASLARLGGMTPVANFFKNAILNNDTPTNSTIVNWTFGDSVSEFEFHNAFAFPNYQGTAPNGQTNAKNIDGVLTDIFTDLSTASDNINNLYFSSQSNPSLSTAPIISSVSPVSVSPGDTVTMSGSFDPNGNEVYIQNINDPSVFYSFYDITPENGNTTLLFTVPQAFDLSDSLDDTIPGTYTVEVAGSNSDFANAGTITIAPTTPATPPTMSSVNFNASTGQGQVSGSNFSTTGNSVGLTPASSSFNYSSILNTASIWNAFLDYIKSLFSFTKVSAQTTIAPTYIIPGLTSSGGSITFSVPSDVPNGTYDVSVMSANTNWVSSSYSITVTGNGTTTSPVTNPVTNPVTSPGTTCTPTGTSVCATPVYSCQSGYSLQSGSNTCTQAGSTISTDVPASSSYTCPSGYTLSGTTCSGPTTSITYAPVVYSCPSGGALSLSGYAHGWICTQSGTFYYATSGCTVGSAQDVSETLECVIPAGTVVTQAATEAYSCSSGTLSGTQCVITTTGSGSTVAATISSYSCPAGYTLSGTTCTPPAPGISSTAPVPTMTAYTTSSTTIVLVFRVSSASNPAPSSYTLLNSNGSIVATVPEGPGYGNTYTVTDLTPNTQYCFSAYSDMGSGVFSATSSQVCTTTGVTLSLSASPTSVYSGQSSVISWSSANAMVCTIFDSNGNQLQGTTTLTAGTVSTGALTTTTTFTGSCLGSHGMSASQSVTVGLINGVEPVPTFTLSAASLITPIGGGYDSISWSSTYASSCNINISGGGNLYSAPTQEGNFSTGMLSTTTTITGSCNGPGGTSAVQSITIVVPVHAKPVLSPKGSASAEGQVKLSWTNPAGYAGIVISRSQTKNSGYVPIATTTSASYIDTGLLSGTTYYYAIQAFYSTASYVQYSPYSATTTVKTLIPSKPVISIPSASITSSSTVINWTDSDSGIALYVVSETSPSTTTIAVTQGSIKTYRVIGLAPSTKYCFAVRSVINPVNISATSTAVCATTKAGSTGYVSLNAAGSMTSSVWPAFSNWLNSVVAW